MGVPPLYGFIEELDVLELLLSEDMPDELSGTLLEPPGSFEDVFSDELPPETSVLKCVEDVEELEKLVVVELELFGLSSSLPELLQPPSTAVIINAAIINESFFFMMFPLP